MTNKHVHCDVIKAWADGAEIQWKSKHASVWYDCDETEPPEWHNDIDYRVKPQPTPDSVVFALAELDFGVANCFYMSNQRQACVHNVRFVFDGDSGKLKNVEMLK